MALLKYFRMKVPQDICYLFVITRVIVGTMKVYMWQGKGCQLFLLRFIL